MQVTPKTHTFALFLNKTGLFGEGFITKKSSTVSRPPFTVKI